MKKKNPTKQGEKKNEMCAYVSFKPQRLGPFRIDTGNCLEQARKMDGPLDEANLT